MSKEQYDFLVFIGRFQPFHNGHKRVVDQALTQSEKVIILVGSSNVARSEHNPWYFEERAEMIRLVYPNEVESGRIILKPLNDFLYNDSAWVENAQHLVDDILREYPGNSNTITLHGLKDIKIGLIGCKKDHTSFYLSLFPTWGSEDVYFLNPINATDIRDSYFDNDNFIDYYHDLPNIDGDLLPESVHYIMDVWWGSDAFDYIREEVAFNKKYKQQWEGSPYPPTLVTVDAAVVQSGHILVVERGAHPGKGQLAMPGGYINENERIKDAVLRELREETKIRVPRPVLEGSIVARDVFDDPNRSSRGRVITHATLFKLKDDVKLPKVKGGDDATGAFWMPLSQVKDNPKEFFEDHWFIIQNLIARL